MATQLHVASHGHGIIGRGRIRGIRYFLRAWGQAGSALEIQVQAAILPGVHAGRVIGPTP